jgi:hypothetical protein
MKTDEDIRRDVEAELRWDPDIDPTDISLNVKDGVVALTGFVKSYLQKFEAEKNAKRVAGVVGVANDLEVCTPASEQLPDPDIAREAVEAIKRQLPLTYQDIKVVVRDAYGRFGRVASVRRRARIRVKKSFEWQVSLMDERRFLADIVRSSFG